MKYVQNTSRISQLYKKQKYHTAHYLSLIPNLFWLISLFGIALEEILFFLAATTESVPDAVDHVLVHVHLPGCQCSKIKITSTYIQGVPSGCTPPFVDVKTKVASHYTLLIQKRNSKLDVNKT